MFHFKNTQIKDVFYGANFINESILDKWDVAWRNINSSMGDIFCGHQELLFNGVNEPRVEKFKISKEKGIISDLLAHDKELSYLIPQLLD